MKKNTELTMALYTSARKEQNNFNYGEYGSECICCGRPMAAGPQRWVHMNEAWVAVNPDLVNEGNCKALTGSNSQGAFPIGSECAKKMAGFTFPSDLYNSHPKFKTK